MFIKLTELYTGRKILVNTNNIICICEIDKLVEEENDKYEFSYCLIRYNINVIGDSDELRNKKKVDSKVRETLEEIEEAIRVLIC